MILKEKKIFIVYILLFSVFCCNNEKQEATSEKFEIINLKDKKPIELAEIISEVEIISLKGLEENEFIVSIDKIIEFDNNYFLLDKAKSNLFVFDTNGLFLRKIGKRGGGPSEYKKINDFVLNKEKKELTILDANNLLVVNYNLDGGFLKKKRINFFAKTFGLIEDKYYVFDIGFDSEDNLNLIFTNLDLDILDKKVKYPKPSPMAYEFLGGINSRSDKVYYTDATSSLIHSVDENFEINKNFEIIVDENTWKYEDRYDFESFNNKLFNFEVSYLRNKYFINNSVLVFEYAQGNQVGIGYYDIDKKLLYAENMKKSPLTMLIKTPLGITSDGKFITEISAESYMSVKSDNQYNIDKEINLLDKNLANELKATNENSNPLLIKYKIF